MKGDKLYIAEVKVTPAEDVRVPAPGRLARHEAFVAGEAMEQAYWAQQNVLWSEQRARSELIGHLLCSAEYETHWRYATHLTAGWVDFDAYVSAHNGLKAGPVQFDEHAPQAQATEERGDV